MMIRSGPLRRIQVYGQRCSGTNALIRTLEANFEQGTFTEQFGFKHWFVPHELLIPDDALVLVIARNPESWLRSLHRNPWHAHPDLKALSFADFIRSEWHSYWDGDFWGVGPAHPLRGREMMHERDPATGQRFRNPLALRTAKLRHWTKLAERAPNVCLVPFELFRDRPEEVVRQLSAIVPHRRPGAFVAVDSYKGHGKRPFRPKDPAPLDQTDRNFVFSQLDPGVESLFGYC
ncbi:hypothetical protein B5C34_13295 [Pacificimonas flava]|uniref:Sulfotransferase domain-containing protein n=2 Tax=Pacificimonas TaxID=1960290 RepID=A0A219B7J7_9SPHN|nr:MULTISPECIES: hypothetical protein [Pacificimonas]MBZ6378355.1 hypothetical protein [Pacificimonas aurantium]OWV34337.1 hypothetical protein B5C34_13295 [Pacificimonas flava]